MVERKGELDPCQMLEQTEVDVSGLLKLTLVIIMNQLRIIKKNNGDLITFTRVTHLVNSRGIADVMNFYFGKNI